ncbi:MAG: flavodoxin family protein, partial [Firmicutes bacterium]|nr:flavodoxin family protein [Bacillota bacterium]
DYSNYFTGTVNFGMILTMNAPQMIYDQMYAARMEEQKNIFARSLNGRAELLTSFDTLQVADYSKYSMGGFSEEHKKSVHENQFPQDLKKAFEMGVSLLK